MIVILDPGVGNLSSVQSGFARAGSDTVVVARGDEWSDLLAARGRDICGVVLPGVGAFGDAMFQLRASGLLQVVRQVARDGMPLFGICLGMQLLFGMSEEHGTHMGLGLIPGKVVRFRVDAKVPHMGWNDLVYVADHPLLTGVRKGDFVYFVHSYHAVLQERDHLLAAADYAGVEVPAVVARGHVYGTQFHPEKSGPVGERILANFVRICEAWRAQREAAQHAE
ncbi:imidazole glycerol phosphate synthase subunit HisH [Alicyclobacillus cellulosilyticus]|uniref:Imidazole glycerol phosphate synthase subunit HisH n=1 Tax=Alicyclobacillus cellulosilyticus TaxID=1003997 RepID=A0A917K7F9_9BACL|nr:imidazole glycerol phosphate synthase subunit HisH [Alicyclobacillus cellulosilyticus]GGJ01560.1 imidazole glycerol phosphate synthase subunit HisH [Alicyclobacillus cellulosilyticus]